MALRWLLTAALLLSFGPLYGQRVYNEIDLSDVGEDLRFDVNSIAVTSTNVEIKRVGGSAAGADLNFAPNLVFLPDSSKAFVSISGSDKIMVFNPVSGEVLDLITVSANPGQLVLSPDGTTLATVCLLLKRNIPQPGGNFEGEKVAQVVLIDVTTHEVRTIDLSQVLVAISNNLVFSNDGKFLYLASAGTDQLLRINLETLEEAGPRIEFTPGIRPMWLAQSPDGTDLAVSLVGSTLLDRVENPDAIAIIDRESFTLRRLLKPETGGTTGELLHDFSASTMLIYSPDGKYLAISDQLVSSTSQLPELASDRLWVFNVEEEEFTRYFVGGVATGVYWAPTGEFLVISALQIDLINPETEEARKFIPLRSQFRPRTKPAFSADGQWLYLPAPISDEIIVYNLETGEVPRYLPVGSTVELDSGVILSSAPLEIAFTPDYQSLVVANFNSNLIDLVESTTHFAIPRVLSDDDWFTGVAITNPTEQDAAVIITGFNNSGGEYIDNDETEDVVEVVNPREVTIEAGTQFAETADEVLQSSEAGAVEGWFDVDTDVPGLRSFFLTGDYAGKRLDGGVAVADASTRLVVPEVQILDGRQTELVLLNPNRQAMNSTIYLIGSDGEVVSSVNRPMASRTVFRTWLRDTNPDDEISDGLFSNTALEDFVDGHLLVLSDTGLIVYERIIDDERMSAINAIPVSDRDPKPTRFILPQFAVFQGNDSIIKLVNANPKAPEDDGEGEPETPTPEEQRLQLTVTVRGNDGLDLAPPLSITLEGGQSLRKSIAELFPSLTDSGVVQSGWVLVEADKPGFVGSAELQVFDGKAASTVGFQSAPTEELIFSHVADGLGLSTGISLINPETEAAVVTVQVLRQDGSLNDSIGLVIDPGARQVGLLSEILPNLEPQIGGFVRVTSSVPLVGLELFFADNLEYMAAVAAQ